jgi:Putative DNA-binding domain
MHWRSLCSTEDSRVRALAELQARVAQVVVMGEREAVVASLVGGANPSKRLEIHRRHYEASLTAALADKFPGCSWVAGADFVSAAARSYVHARPPQQPCIAEYGADFPEFLAGHDRASALPYLRSFAELEWAVGQASIAIECPPVSWLEIARVGSETLVDVTLSFQPGVRYVRSAWGVDELMTMYLSGSEPERFVLPASNTFIEVRGARGTVHLARLDGATFAFRDAAATGRAIGDAASRALEFDSTFDPGEALRLLVQSGLVTESFIVAQDAAS